MNILIFAGGMGTRLWPLSRRNSPKQFEKLKDNQSTLQMAVERVRSFGLENVYVATAKQYVPLVEASLPDMPRDAIFSEPARRDLAAAVLLALLRLKKKGVTGTTAILWADHFMDHPDRFVAALQRSEELLQEHDQRFVFLGEKPRFPNHELGWIEVGEQTLDGAYAFRSWKYRPEKEACEAMHASGQWFWNPGYFVGTIDFILGLYARLQPELLSVLREVIDDEKRLDGVYATLPQLHFDKAIVEHIAPEEGVVLPVDLGWSDPGTLYALKEALVGSGKENYTKGLAVLQDSSDCFVYNEDAHKLITTIGLEGMIVVNTKDGLLVCPKDKVSELKTVLPTFESLGLEKYL